ncbi:MAG: acyloxyacyl hydrolase [Leptospirillum sp.]|jgi:hypothetical protein
MLKKHLSLYGDKSFFYWKALFLGVLIGALFFPLYASAVQILGDENPYLNMGAGVFNLVGGTSEHRYGFPSYDHSPAEGNVEYQSGETILGIGYALGILANSDGAVDGYGGIFFNIALSPHWILTPMGGIGGYDQNNSKFLGSVFMFRLEMTFAYQMDNGDRVGLKFAHLSNSDIAHSNPGENEVLLNYAVPLKLP